MARYILSSKKIQNTTHFFMATEIIESTVLTNSRYEKEDEYLSHRFFFLLFENTLGARGFFFSFGVIYKIPSHFEGKKKPSGHGG